MARGQRATQSLLQQLPGLSSAQERHTRFVHLATSYAAPPAEQLRCQPSRTVQTDHDVLRSTYRFLRSAADDDDGAHRDLALARKYYAKLFRTYAIADLSQYKAGRLGLRWRTKKEVEEGRGQFICGAKNCEERAGLASFEVPFAYKELGKEKQALVKVRVCPKHAQQLTYTKTKEALKAQQKRKFDALEHGSTKAHKRTKLQKHAEAQTVADDLFQDMLL